MKHQLPSGCKTIIADGKTYYVSNGTFYIQPQGKSSYIVVTPPFGIEVSELPKDAVASTWREAPITSTTWCITAKLLMQAKRPM